jgi:hypothetical protein
MLNSPLHSYLLAEAFGLYLVIMSVILLSRENYYRKLMTQEPHYPSLLSCSLSLLISIFLLLIHNLWGLHPRLVVTLVCWLYFIRNILLIAYPEWVFKVIRQICVGKMYYLTLFMMATAGVLLLIRGSFIFFALIHP